MLDSIGFKISAGTEMEWEEKGKYVIALGLFIRRSARGELLMAVKSSQSMVMNSRVSFHGFRLISRRRDWALLELGGGGGGGGGGPNVQMMFVVIDSVPIGFPECFRFWRMRIFFHSGDAWAFLLISEKRGDGETQAAQKGEAFQHAGDVLGGAGDIHWWQPL